MIIDCHVHAGELNKHYPIWWIEELYRVWGGVHQWTYDRRRTTCIPDGSDWYRYDVHHDIGPSPGLPERFWSLHAE